MNNYFNAFMGFLIPNALVPINEIYAWSNNEKIHILFHKVNELVTQGNLYGDGFKKLQDLFNDLDDTLQKEVVEYIEELYNSGKLTEIIGSAISNSLEGKSGAIDLQHIGRVVHIAHNWQNASDSSSFETTNDVERYNYAQGGVVFDYEGERYWAVAYVCNNGTHFRYNNACYIYIYKFNADNNTMVYVTRKEFANAGHANGMGYMNGYIYITPNSYQVQDISSPTGYSGVLSTDIHRVSFNGTLLGNLETKTVDLNYNNAYIDGVCSDGLKLYFFDGQGDVFEYDWNTNLALKIYENIKGDNTAYGGMQITDNFIYFADYGNYKIIRFNRNLNTIDWAYNLPVKADNNTYRCGEFENFTIIDGNIYILGCYSLGRSVQPFTMTRFFRQNLSKNNLSSINQLYGWSSPTNTYYQTFYVNGDYYNDTDNPSNPTGIHRDRAFKSLLEAIDFIDSSDWVERGIIKILQSQNTTPTEICTTKPIHISGLEYYQSNNEVPILGSIYGIFNTLVIEYIAVRNLIPSGNGYLTDNCFYFYNCNVSLLNIYLPTGLISNSERVKNGITINRGIVNFLNSTDFEHYVLPSYWETLRSNLGISNPKYINCYDSIVNTHFLYGVQDTNSPLTNCIIK
jgi:hypothetical protein